MLETVNKEVGHHRHYNRKATMNDIAQLITTYGLSIILSACFIWQYFSAVKHNETREDLLYQTIDTTLAEMQQNLAEIQKNMAVMLEKMEHMDTGMNE